MAKLCIHCKAIHADSESCPMEQQYRELFSAAKPIGDHLEGAAPNVFVGRHGYPKVNVGFLAPDKIHEAEIFDAPRTWSKEGFSVDHVADLRRSLIQSRFVAGIQETNRYVEMAQEVVMAQKPTDVNIDLQAKPRQLNDFDGISAPYGPTGMVKKVDLSSNAKVPIAIEKAVGDTDATATTAMHELYNKDFDEQALTKLLSLGTLGRGSMRKLVPTRWSITATDDSLGKHLREEIQDFSESEHQLFFGGYLGNFYLIMVFPGPFSYELFEISTKSESLPYGTDYESFKGRSRYAEETAGGYYACRYPILEYLHRNKRQGAVLALRFITPAYTAPLGVWVVREATRKALAHSLLYASDRSQLLEKAKSVIQEKLNIDIGQFLKKSKLLDELTSQTRLSNFF